MTMLSLIVAVLLAAIGTGVGLLTSWWSAPAIVAALVPLVFEVGVRVTIPIEERVALGYQKNAEARLREFDPKIIAVTGSWGKTTTKNHISDLASGLISTTVSPASYNNRAGLSRTVNEHLSAGIDLLVVEMGTYGRGEIRSLCSWVRPQVAVITAIGPMHLERMGSIAEVARAKSEILETADVAALWVEDPRVDELAQAVAPGASPTILRCGIYGRPGLDISVECTAGGLVVRVAGNEIGATSPGAGLHPANVGCAVAALLAVGLPPERLGQRLAMLSAPAHRASLGRSDAGLVVIDDTFNSNPVGAAAALGRLSAEVTGRRVVITPGMMELGAHQFEANQDFAAAVIASGAELIVIGHTNRKSLTKGAQGAGGRPWLLRSRRDAVRWVGERLGSGDGVLWENDLPDHYP